MTPELLAEFLYARRTKKQKLDPIRMQVVAQCPACKTFYASMPSDGKCQHCKVVVIRLDFPVMEWV